MPSLYSPKDKFVFDLLKRQLDMLKDKTDCLEELFDLCDNEEQRGLVKNLLIDFSEMNDEVFNLCLLDMRDAIISKGFPFEDCLVVAMAHDHLADSSQDVLHSIEIPLGMKGFPISNFCNRFDHCWGKKFKDKYHHYFIIDDFVGSGSTVLNRKNEFEKLMKNKEYTLHFVVVAGMEYAIENLRNQGIDIHCSYTMKKGISEKYADGLIQRKLQIMSDLESKLATTINETQLGEHHFGYGQAESLFCRRHKNIPNNVFPLFWWKRYVDNRARIPLFTRMQEGY
jgi:hypothetical protein